MAKRIPVSGDMTAIGEVKTPPFARLPEPVRLFERRAARLRALSGADGIGPYLGFLAALAAAQARVAVEAPAPQGPDEAHVERALEYGMPPLDRSAFRPDETFRRMSDRLFEAAKGIGMPAAAAAALERVSGDDPLLLERAAVNVLSDAIPVEEIAEHAFVAAALQVHFATLASLLPEKRLKAVAEGAACPACGGPPVSSVIVGWPQAGGARFCACSLCATFWHHVRIKCVQCSSTKGIRYQEIEGGPGTIKAETCDACRSYLKVFNQQKDVSLEPFADDIGSLGLDLLMKGTEFRRAGFNPFLVGY